MTNDARAQCALITGGNGQDAHYLAQLLANKNYQLHIQSLSGPNPNWAVPSAIWHTVSLTEEGGIEGLIRAIRPDEIYNLASVSSPSESWERPIEVAAVNAVLPHRILELIRNDLSRTRFFQASSSDMFGDQTDQMQSELTPLQPQTPYAVAKAYAHSMVGAYRSRHKVFACSGILFNHESPLRRLNYVSQKIATAAALVSLHMTTSDERDELGRPILVDGILSLGNLQVRRDFGFAGDHVRAMWLMLQKDKADDYVIGTGHAHSIAEVCEVAFSHIGQDWRDHVVVDPQLVRNLDSRYTRADISKATSDLGWQPETTFDSLIRMMVDARIEMFRLRSIGSA